MSDWIKVCFTCAVQSADRHSRVARLSLFWNEFDDGGMVTLSSWLQVSAFALIDRVLLMSVNGNGVVWQRQHYHCRLQQSLRLVPRHALTEAIYCSMRGAHRSHSLSRPLSQCCFCLQSVAPLLNQASNSLDPISCESCVVPDQAVFNEEPTCVNHM